MSVQTTIAISKDTLKLIQERRSRLKASNSALRVRKDLSNGRIVHDLLAIEASKYNL